MDRRDKTLHKLGAICRRIEVLLAGQNVTLADVPLPQEAKPGEKPLEKLRRFKALLNETLGAMDEGIHPCCKKCRSPLLDVVLDEMPWATWCQECAPKAEAKGPYDRER